MEQQPYVFISYARHDSHKVDKIVSFLEAKGIRIWRDTNQIQPGQDWSAAIGKALEKASVFVFVSSVNSAHSEWMRDELGAVVSRSDRLIIPVILDEKGASSLPLYLSTRQWIDLRSEEEQNLINLYEAIARVVRPSFESQKSGAITKGYVFISYSVDDREFLEGLKKILFLNKYGYWDFHESKRDYQTQFHLELEGIIRESSAVLCVISPSWKRSRWAPREYLFSEDIRKPIFLLKAKPLEPTLLIAGSSFIDFTENSEHGYDELNRELQARGL